MNKLLQKLTEHADSILSLQDKNGAFPAGRNGPYLDIETPVRNTSHALYLFAALYKVVESEKYKVAVLRAFNYLVNHAERAGDYTLVCRNCKGKDRTNGVIGQAWVIEALLEGEYILGEDAYNYAFNIYLDHQFDNSYSAWRAKDNKVKRNNVDFTFNHQLWFASAISKFQNSERVSIELKQFLENNCNAIETYSDGTIFHNTPIGSAFSDLNPVNGLNIKRALARIKNAVQKNKLYEKSCGYHAFNLYALATLKENRPELDYWKAFDYSVYLNPIKRINYFFDERVKKFGCYYNMSGYELAYFIKVFECSSVLYWIEQQEKWLNEAAEADSNLVDNITLKFRAYEVLWFIK